MTKIRQLWRRLMRRVFARCRWCDNNFVWIGRMAIYSYKPSFGGFTGVCKACMNSDDAEAKYHERMYRQGMELAEKFKP